MYQIVIKVVHAAAKQAFEIALISGAVHAVTNFVFRRLGRQKLARNEGEYVARDVYKGAVQIFTDHPVTMSAYVVGAGAAAVNPFVGLCAVAFGTGWYVGEMFYSLVSEYRAGKRSVKAATAAFDEALESLSKKPRFTKEENDALNDLAKAATAAEPENSEALKESFKVEADLDAEVLRSSGKNARAYGYSWYDENFAGKGISFAAIKKAANEALIRAGISGNRKVLFFRGMEEAAAS